MPYEACNEVTWTGYQRRGRVAREKQYQNSPDVSSPTRTLARRLHALVHIQALAGIVAVSCGLRSLHWRSKFRHRHVVRVMCLSSSKTF